jgi:arylsulfatase A
MSFSQPTGNRRAFFRAAAGAAAFGATALAQRTGPPNIVLILADDLGYGDLGCYGSTISTPAIDQVAREGVRFTQFNAASSVCSPSRAAFLTGRYATRMGIPRVLDVNDTNGIPDSETTMAQMLKSAGYATMCVGKWHLGNLPQYLPTNRGFDQFYGIPYSIDQGTRPLMYNTDVIEEPANLETLTQRYTQIATDFISRSKGAPFFLYLPHAFPHLPLASSSAFSGRSGQGMYGDAVQEIDWSVAQIMQSLRANGLDSNTLVMVTSDHGPWYQGSSGGLRGRKGESYEGGLRVPFIARYPGFVPGGRVCEGFATALDLVPTIAALTGAPPPPNPLDGIDISGMLNGQENDLPRDAFLYFNDVHLQCARLGSWKMHVSRYSTPAFCPTAAPWRFNLPLPCPEVYDVVADRDEAHDRAPRNAGVVADIQSRINRLIQTFPTDILSAWNNTMAIPVEGTPAGCYPIRKAP